MKYDVHYCSALAMLNDQRMPGDDIGTIPEFDRYYRYIGTFEASTLDDLFRKLQNGGGGLGDRTMQDYVIRYVQHTSMSVGDIAIERETGCVWFLALRGWKQIQLKAE